MSRRGRGRRNEQPGPSGFLVLDKPMGWTSHQAVDAARRWFGTRRVGHLGTLDPLATGVLPIAVRDATKLIPYVTKGRRVYVGTIRLGVATDTFDAEGRVVSRHEGTLPDEAAVREALGGFVGVIDQIPPMYSAVKHEGEPLHRIARRGGEVERKPRQVEIHYFELRGFRSPDAEIAVSCSAGTYVRTLAQDIGERLGCGAHLAGLQRTESGPFHMDRAVSVAEMDEAATKESCDGLLIDPLEVLGLSSVRLDALQCRRISHGAPVEAPPAAASPPIGSRVGGVDPSGILVAILELRPDRQLHPLRVLSSLAPQGSL